MARYLGVSGRPLSSHDLLQLGLVSHIVSSNVPADSLCIALAHSLPDSDKIKAVQSTQTHRPAVVEILDSMHLYMTRNDFFGANQMVDNQPAGFAEVEDTPAPEQVMGLFVHQKDNIVFNLSHLNVMRVVTGAARARQGTQGPRAEGQIRQRSGTYIITSHALLLSHTASPPHSR